MTERLSLAMLFEALAAAMGDLRRRDKAHVHFGSNTITLWDPAPGGITFIIEIREG